MACFLLVGYGLARLRERLGRPRLWWLVPTVWLAVTATEIGVATGWWLLGETAVPLTDLLPRALGVGAYTAGVSLPVLMITDWIREPLCDRRTRLADL
jgi:hypothetical protein